MHLRKQSSEIRRAQRQIERAYNNYETDSELYSDEEAEEQEGAGQDYYEDTLDEGNGGEMEDQMDAADDEDGQE